MLMFDCLYIRIVCEWCGIMEWRNWLLLMKVFVWFMKNVIRNSVVKFMSSLMFIVLFGNIFYIMMIMMMFMGNIIIRVM